MIKDVFCSSFFYPLIIKYGYTIWLWNLSRKGDERIDRWTIIGIHHGFVSHVLADINEPNSTIILQDRCRAIILLKVKDDIKMVVNNTRLVYAQNI